MDTIHHAGLMFQADHKIVLQQLFFFERTQSLEIAAVYVWLGLDFNGGAIRQNEVNLMTRFGTPITELAPALIVDEGLEFMGQVGFEGHAEFGRPFLDDATVLQLSDDSSVEEIELGGGKRFSFFCLFPSRYVKGN